MEVTDGVCIFVALPKAFPALAGTGSHKGVRTPVLHIPRLRRRTDGVIGVVEVVLDLKSILLIKLQQNQ